MSPFEWLYLGFCAVTLAFQILAFLRKDKQR